MTEQAQRVMDWIADSRDDMVALIERLVNIDSGSYDKAGVDAVGDAIVAFLNAHGVQTDRIAIAEKGDAIRATVPAAGGNRPIMLLGHRDTVFPKGEVERRPFKIDGNRAYGPGVSDMKSGLVMNAFVLAGFQKFGGAPAPLIGLFTGDEEIGSQTSRPIIEATARDAAMVFNSEPARSTGNIVTGRKGGIFLIADVEGVAAHSGANFDKGRSAIEELARKIQAWHALVDVDAGLTVNVGLISGGQSVNTVAPHARAEIDVRYIAPKQRDEIVAQITEIATACTVDGTRGSVTIRGEFSPLVQTPAAQAQFDHYIASAKSMGVDIGGEFTGGCADSGFTAGVGTPTVCAVGPVGGNAHSPEEYLELDTVVPRTQVLAKTIATITLG
ncbi:MAG: M20 family metallopeptidase [Pseudomonadota bacterium]